MLGEAIQPHDMVDARYRPLRVLGQGGFGTTYLAEDLHLQRTVVLKLTSAPDDDAAHRLAAEADALARIDHPRIAHLLGRGRHQGRLYLVIEWVDGPDLQSILRRGPLPLGQALVVLQAMAEALVAAHAAGVIHRDLKPSNIVVPGGRFEEAKLVDFDVLGELHRSAGSAAGQTRAGQFFGTPTYMAPEQILAGPNTPATDIFGLGVLLYEMLVGRTPFGGDDPSAFELLRRITTEEVTIPPETHLPPDVRTFLLQCLQKDPARRPQTAAEALAAIRRLRRKHTGAPRAETDDTAPAQASTPALPAAGLSRERRPARYVLAAALALVAGTALVAALALAAQGTLPSFRPAPLFVGLALIAAGILAGIGVRALIERRRHHLQQKANRILSGARQRGDLSQSLALQVDELILRCREVDERILGLSIAQMVGEYQRAKTSNDRQAALMNASQLLDKLMSRLSPWYVRHEKLIALTISLLGILSGLLSALSSLG